MSNFHPLEFVGRGSETQLQVRDFFNVAFYGLKPHVCRPDMTRPVVIMCHNIMGPGNSRA